MTAFRDAMCDDHLAWKAHHVGDARIDGRIGPARSSGLPDVRTGWGAMFDGDARFVVFSHQAWCSWVAAATDAPDWTVDWRSWIGERYAYARAPGWEGA